MNVLNQPRTIINSTTIRHAMSEETQRAAKYPQHVYITLLNALLAADLLFNCNEELKGTSAYRFTLKQKINQLQPELEKIINEDLDLLIGSNENARVIFSLEDGIKKFIEQLSIKQYAKHEPALLAGLGELLEKFHSMPEWVLHHNGIKIKEVTK